MCCSLARGLLLRCCLMNLHVADLLQLHCGAGSLMLGLQLWVPLVHRKLGC